MYVQYILQPTRRVSGKILNLILIEFRNHYKTLPQEIIFKPFSPIFRQMKQKFALILLQSNKTTHIL